MEPNYIEIHKALKRYSSQFQEFFSNLLNEKNVTEELLTKLEDETDSEKFQAFMLFLTKPDLEKLIDFISKSNSPITGEELFTLISENLENKKGKAGIFKYFNIEVDSIKKGDVSKSAEEKKAGVEPPLQIKENKKEIAEMLAKYENLNEKFMNFMKTAQENEILAQKFEEKFQASYKILEEKNKIIEKSQEQISDLQKELNEFKQWRKNEKEQKEKERKQALEQKIQENKIKEEKELEKKKEKEREAQKKDIQNNQENVVAIEAVSDVIEPIKKNEFYIELRIKFPYEKNLFGKNLLNFMRLDDLKHNKDNMEFMTNFFNQLLSRRMVCEMPNQIECDLVPFRCREDKFGQWKYDFLFDMMKIIGVLKENGRLKFFPIYWKIKEGVQNLEPYDIRIVEMKDDQRVQIDENMPITAFFKNISEKTGKNRVSNSILNDFLKNDVKTVKDLMNIKATTPEVFNKYFAIKVEIYEELDRAATNSAARGDAVIQDPETFFSEEKKQIDYKGRAFKILRYFHSIQNKSKEIGFLKEEIIDEAYQLIRKEFLNEELLLKIKSFYQVMTKRPIDGISKIPRGIMFYGPPGTGKTTVAEKFPDLIGLTAICTPLSSTELNRSLVGETEQLVTQICERAKNYPHLLCYLSIDEIDAMVPRRDDKDNKNKGDTVNTLLALIGGNKDVPNLVFIASTNFIKKIDEAISRRMNGKFFVGRMDSEAREIMLNKAVNESLTEEKLRNKNEWAQKQKINYMSSFGKKFTFKLEEAPIESFKKAGINEEQKLILIEKDKLSNFNVALINFTPAAMENLSNQIKNFMLDCGKLKYDFTIKELLEFALVAAKQINIKFGIFYIPEIYINLGLYKEMNTKAAWKKPDNAEGLVVVNLAQQIYNFKIAKLEKKVNGFKKKLIFEERLILNKDITNNVNDIIDDIARFANDNGIQTMQLIDLPSMINNQAFDESKMQENINEIVTELKEYTHSLMVIDMDSLISSNISESNSSMGPSTSVSLSKINLFYFIRDLASTCPFLKYGVNGDLEGSFWIFLVSHDKFLLKTMVSALKIEKSEKEQKRLEEEEKKEKMKFECLRCEKLFQKKDNKDLNVCQYHVGYVVDSSQDKEEWRLIDLFNEEEKRMVEMAIVLKENKKLENSGNSDSDDEEDSKEEKKEDDNPFFHICCRKKYNEQGCKNNYHLENNSEKDKKEFEKERNKDHWEEVLRSLII